jgi:conjugal transfer pilus assembly protein TraK
MLRNRTRGAACVLWASALALAAPALGQQVVDASDGKARIVDIAQKDPSRIAVDGGRIVNIVYDEQDLVATVDRDNGQVFVTPRGSRPVSVFVVTDKGKTHPLVLQPKDVPLQTVLIREGRAQGADTRPLARVTIDRAGAHDLAVKRLVAAMARGERPVEYTVREFNRPVSLWQEALFVLLARYEGREFIGEHYRLANSSGSVMRIAEQELFKPGVVAVAIELHQLQPGQSTDVFVLREARDE